MTKSTNSRRKSLSGLRDEVIMRDRQCIAAALDRSHVCRDKFGDEHDPDDMPKLTLEHVKRDGIRYDSIDHCIALCSEANVVQHWTSPPANNRLANAYLRGWRVGVGRL